MQQIFLVGAGGFLGSVFRYALSGAVQRWFPLSTFPYGTLAVNLAGCFVIGFLAGLARSRQLFGPEARLFLFLGVLGGFTTFSTFGYETYAMARDADFLRAGANASAHLLVGLFAVWLGSALSRAW